VRLRLSLRSRRHRATEVAATIAKPVCTGWGSAAEALPPQPTEVGFAKVAAVSNRRENAKEEMMRAPYTQLYLHLVWATWDRLPLVTEMIRPRIYAAIAEKCQELKCVPLAIGGTEDHMHLLVRLHTAVTVAALAKEVKGSSSHLVSHEVRPADFFKWQGAYGAFTIWKGDVPVVIGYVERQQEHHATGDLRVEWEQTATEEKESEG
jgi:putative transposase